MMHGILRTDRLLLRPAATADAPRLIAINEPTATERITQFVENQLNWWNEYSYGLWLIVLPTTETLAGWCGLRPGSSPKEPELLVWSGCGRAKARDCHRGRASRLGICLRVAHHSVCVGRHERKQLRIGGGYEPRWHVLRGSTRYLMKCRACFIAFERRRGALNEPSRPGAVTGDRRLRGTKNGDISLIALSVNASF